MTPKSKQIIIDKSAFEGITLDALCNFAERHLLLLCSTLWYECATTDVQKAGRLVDKCRCLIEKGGYICMGDHAQFIQWEGKNCVPYPHCLMDLNATAAVRNGQVQCDKMANSEVAQQALQSRWTVADRMLVEESSELKLAMNAEYPQTVKVMKSFQGSRGDRLKVFLDAVDRSDIHQMAINMWRPWIKDVREFCTSRDWITWQFVRLIQTLKHEYHYLRQTSDPRDEHAEHDLQDIEYVLLLSRADGIITKDTEQTELARAAFTKKDVFSSLEEVPESYRYDWAEA